MCVAPLADRYDTTGNPEDEYYPGTSVLTNLEDIRDPSIVHVEYTVPHFSPGLTRSGCAVCFDIKLYGHIRFTFGSYVNPSHPHHAVVRRST